MRPIESVYSSFRMGRWLVQPALNRITDSTQMITLGPRLMGVLIQLAKTPGEVVTREALLDAVWEDVVINEDALTRAISELRKILGDDPNQPAYIETIRHVGYVLVASVSFDEAKSHDAPSLPPPTSTRTQPLFYVGLLLVGGLAVLGLMLWLVLHPDPAPVQLLQATPFTSFPGRETDAAISPDGRQVAFAWSGPDGDNYDIYLKQDNTATPLRLTHSAGRDVHPSWSPDGSTLAFVRTEVNEHGQPTDEYGLYLVPSIGGPEQKLIDTQHWSRGLDWSPYGASLVFADHQESGGQYHLFLLSLDSREKTQLTSPPSQYSDHTPLFSPDGKTIAFLRSQPMGLADEIFLVSATGGEPRPLTQEQLDIAGMDWTADGKHLIFAAERVGLRSLWRVAVSDGAITWVPVSGELIAYPTIARSNNRLLYEQSWSEMNIWQLADSSQAMEPFISSTYRDSDAYFAPDGNRIAFVSTRSGHPELWICDRNGANLLQLTRFSGVYVGRPQWSPDGQRLAFYANPDGHTALFTIDAEGGQPRRLLDSEANDLLPTWSADGRWIYFSSDHSGDWQLWKTTPEGDQLLQITTEGGILPAASMDGAWLYYTRPDVGGIWRIPVDGGTPERTLNASRIADHTNWTLTKDGLYFIESMPEGPTLSFFDYTSQTTTPLTPLSSLAQQSLSVSPTTGAILFARIERVESNLVMIDNFR